MKILYLLSILLSIINFEAIADSTTIDDEYLDNIPNIYDINKKQNELIFNSEPRLKRIQAQNVQKSTKFDTFIGKLIYNWNSNNNIWELNSHYEEEFNTDGTISKIIVYDTSNIIIEKSIYTYDSTNNTFTLLVQLIDSLKLLKNAFYITIVTDNKGNYTNYLYQTWDDNLNQWINKSKYYMEYDLYSNPIKYENYVYDLNNWNLESAVEYHYQYYLDQITEYLIKRYDFHKQIFVNESVKNYDFNTHNQIEFIRMSHFDTTTQHWNLTSKQVFYYDSLQSVKAGPIRTDYSENINGTLITKVRIDSLTWREWKGLSSYYSSYPLSSIRYEVTLPNNSLQPRLKIKRDYIDSNGSVISDQYRWKNSKWEKEYSTAELYDPLKNKELSVTIFYDSTTKIYKRRYNNSYDMLNRLSEIVVQDSSFMNTDFVNYEKINYYYSINTGINSSLSQSKSFDIFPNPSNLKFYMRINHNCVKEEKIYIYNISGNLIREYKLAPLQKIIELELETNGMYIVSYNGQQERISIQP